MHLQARFDVLLPRYLLILQKAAEKIQVRDLANFLNIALGSANETEYHLLLAKDLGYLSLETYEELDNRINEVKAMLISLINKIRHPNI